LLLARKKVYQPSGFSRSFSEAQNAIMDESRRMPRLNPAVKEHFSCEDPLTPLAMDATMSVSAFASKVLHSVREVSVFSYSVN
jgi:hypothetical protein